MAKRRKPAFDARALVIAARRGGADWDLIEAAARATRGKIPVRLVREIREERERPPPIRPARKRPAVRKQRKRKPPPPPRRRKVQPATPEPEPTPEATAEFEARMLHFRKVAQELADEAARNEARRRELYAQARAAIIDYGRSWAPEWNWLFDDAPVIGKTKRGFNVPDPDYMLDAADDLDVDVSDLYDAYYGETPGSST